MNVVSYTMHPSSAHATQVSCDAVLTHIQVFQLWDTSIVKFLGQRDFSQGAQLGQSKGSDVRRNLAGSKTDFSERKLLIFFLPHKVYARDAAGQDVYHAHTHKSTVETVKLMI